MTNLPSKHKRKYELSAAGRFQMVIGLGFLCLAWMDYLSSSAPSGKWAWLENLFIKYFGPYGFIAALVTVGIFLTLSSIFEMIKTSKEETK